MNEVCLESCAIKRDCSEFQVKKDLRLEDMPRFPDAAGMTKEEKFTSVTIYLAKVVDHLQGVENEHTTYPFLRRQNLYRAGDSDLLKNLKVKDLLPSIQKGDPSLEDRTEREDSPHRP